VNAISRGILENVTNVISDDIMVFLDDSNISQFKIVTWFIGIFEKLDSGRFSF